MAFVAYLVVGNLFEKERHSFSKIIVGIVTAVLLYFVFYLGNYAVTHLNLLGIGANNEQSIYGLFSGVPLPLLIIVLALDAIGFEYYFRGNLQNLFAKRIGIGAVFLVAIIDALIHISTLNPLFPATVLVADSIWGLNYYFTKDSLLEHRKPLSLGSFDFRGVTDPLKPEQGLITGTKRGQERTSFLGKSILLRNSREG